MEDLKVRYSFQGSKGKEAIELGDSRLTALIQNLEMKLKEKAITTWLNEEYGTKRAKQLHIHFN